MNQLSEEERKKILACCMVYKSFHKFPRVTSQPPAFQFRSVMVYERAEKRVENGDRDRTLPLAKFVTEEAVKTKP